MEMSRFGWLHISDMHIGQAGNWNWPNFRAEFLSDIKLFTAENPINLVIFSGDITQRGSEEQFNAATDELLKLWEVFKSLDQKPVFFAVPGNHDLVRPNSKDATMKMLMRWADEPEVKNEFWSSGSNQYSNLVANTFQTYRNWINSLEAAGIPLPEIHQGLLPGDCSTVISVNGLKIGLIGLNTAFLQLSDGELKGKLALDGRQIFALTENDPPKWIGSNSLNFLVTHHPLDWLNPESQADFLAEIFPSGRFVAHLHGHMHEFGATTIYQGGDKGRRFFQNTSLFGLEYLSDGKTDRRHGYAYGAIEVEIDTTKLKLWPRIGIVNRSSGKRKIAPDHTNFDLLQGTDYYVEILSQNSTSSKIPEPQAVDLAVAVEETSGKWSNALSSSKYVIRDQPQHLEIRHLQQQAALESLRQTKICWICANWGMGRDGFIWSIVAKTKRNKFPIYKISLENYRDRQTFLDNFSAYAGTSFPEFCKALTASEDCTLIFDDSPVSSVENQNLVENDVEHLALMVSDFCPKVQILILAQSIPKFPKHGSVVLEQLDEADTKSYLSAHPNAVELRHAYAVSEIFRVSDGLPTKIDSTLQTLRVVNLSELLPNSLTPFTQLSAGGEPIPISLISAINDLAKSPDSTLKRSYFMLKVLCVLPHGESLQRIKRLDPTAPIFPRNAEELLNRNLIEVRLSSALMEGNEGDDRVKILVAPRAVREHVLSMMSQRDIDRIVKQAIVLYFGDEWKTTGSFKKLGANLTSDDGSLLQNPNSLVLQMAQKQATWQDKSTAKGLLNICQVYCVALYSNKHYRNCVTVCRDILTAIPENEYQEERNSIKYTFAKALRMGNEVRQAELLLEELQTSTWPKSMQADLALTYALCLQSLNKDELAISAAKQVIANSDSKSSIMQAKGIVIEIEAGIDSEKKLLKLEKDARQLGYSTVANNLTLDRVQQQYGENPEGAEVLLEDVYQTAMASDDPYSATRAIVHLGILKRKHSISLTPKEINRLIESYQYLYGQRFSSLFLSAHRSLWKHFEESNDTRNLLSLFRHSSFIWRLDNNEEEEHRCVKLLEEKARHILNTNILTADKNTAYFLLRAQRIKRIGSSKEEPKR